MSTKAHYHAGVQTFFDGTTFETVLPMSPLYLYDDFVGAGAFAALPTAATLGTPWVKKIVLTAGTPTVGGVANAGGGVVALALEATSEKQDAVLYMADQKNFDVTKGAIYEARVALAVLPSAAGVQTVFGLSSNWIDGPNNAAEYLEFGATASGAILLRSKDGTNTFSIASGVTVVAGAYHIFRIDATVPTDIKYFIDGAQVSATNAISFAATGASAILQAYASVYKPSGTGLATTNIDYVRVYSNR